MKFTPLEISVKLAIAIGVGMLVGLEREWSQKDLGNQLRQRPPQRSSPCLCLEC